MHSAITNFIPVPFNKDAHSSIAYNTVIIVINVLYKLKNVHQTLVIFSFCVLLIVVITVGANTKLLT